MARRDHGSEPRLYLGFVWGGAVGVPIGSVVGALMSFTSGSYGPSWIAIFIGIVVCALLGGVVSLGISRSRDPNRVRFSRSEDRLVPASVGADHHAANTASSQDGIRTLGA